MFFSQIWNESQICCTIFRACLALMFSHVLSKTQCVASMTSTASPSWNNRRLEKCVASLVLPRNSDSWHRSCLLSSFACTVCAFPWTCMPFWASWTNSVGLLRLKQAKPQSIHRRFATKFLGISWSNKVSMQGSLPRTPTNTTRWARLDWNSGYPTALIIRAKPSLAQTGYQLPSRWVRSPQLFEVTAVVFYCDHPKCVHSSKVKHLYTDCIMIYTI